MKRFIQLAIVMLFTNVSKIFGTHYPTALFLLNLYL